MAFASAEGGAGTIPKDMFLLAHQNEMVLPAPLAGGMRSLIQSPNFLAGMPSLHSAMGVMSDSMARLHSPDATAGGSTARAAGGAGAPSGSGGSGPSQVTHNHNNHVELEYHSHGSPGIQKEELTGLVKRAMRMGELP